MQGNSGQHRGVTAFALIGVRCTRLEHGYMPHNYYHSQLPPIYEDKVIGNPEPAQKVSTLRRSPSPINVLTNGSFYNSFDAEKTLPMRNSKPNNIRQTSSIRRHSSDVTLNSSKMLNDMIGRKYRRKSDPCLSSYIQTGLEAEQTLETSSSNSSLESLVIDVEGGNRRKDQSQETPLKARSSIYSAHPNGPTLFSQYIISEETIETFRRPKPLEKQPKSYLLCSTEKKIRKKLFLLCFGIFVSVVLFFLVSIMTGLLFPRAMFDTDQTAYVYPPTSEPDTTTQHNLRMNQ